MQMSDVQWGDVPGWIEAMSTLGAFGVAGVAAVFAWRTWNSTKGQLAEAKVATQVARKQAEAAEEQLQLEWTRDGERLRMAQREQADQIAAWLVRGVSTNSDLTNVEVLNGSSQPVFQFAVYEQINLNVSTHERYQRPMLGPGPVLPFFSGMDLEVRNRMDEATRAGLPAGLCLTFTDIHGQGWTRRWDGELVPGRERFIPTFDEQQLKRTTMNTRPDQL